MKKMIIAAAAMSAVTAAYATPTVTDTTIEQLSSRTVKVTYTLDEDAVVTLDILTNATADAWVSIGAENISHTWGDVNVLVKGAGTHTLYWAPEKSWTDQVGEKYTVKALVKAWAKDAPPDFMVVDLETPGAIRYYETAKQLPDGGLTNDCYRLDRLVMRKIPAKGVQWRMGSPSNETGRKTGKWEAEETTHYVTLTNDYYMGVFEVTKRQAWYMGASWAAVDVAKLPADQTTYVLLRGDNASYDWPANGHAVDPNSFIGKIRTLTGIDTFDLPTEARWEYACRAGASGSYNNGSDVGAVAWYKDNSGSATHRVGEKLPNAWGLYDMHGNVYELCLDWAKDDLGSATVIEPEIARTAIYGTENDNAYYKISRGGGYNSEDSECRSSYRTTYTGVTMGFLNTGFRLTCDAVAK